MWLRTLLQYIRLTICMVHSPTMASSSLLLPSETWSEIFKYKQKLHRPDLANICRVNRLLNSIARFILYKNVVLKLDIAHHTLALLHQDINLAARVNSLHLRHSGQTSDHTPSLISMLKNTVNLQELSITSGIINSLEDLDLIFAELQKCNDGRGISSYRMCSATTGFDDISDSMAFANLSRIAGPEALGAFVPGERTVISGIWFIGSSDSRKTYSISHCSLNQHPH